MPMVSHGPTCDISGQGVFLLASLRRCRDSSVVPCPWFRALQAWTGMPLRGTVTVGSQLASCPGRAAPQPWPLSDQRTCRCCCVAPSSPQLQMGLAVGPCW